LLRFGLPAPTRRGISSVYGPEPRAVSRHEIEREGEDRTGRGSIRCGQGSKVERPKVEDPKALDQGRGIRVFWAEGRDTYLFNRLVVWDLFIAIVVFQKVNRHFPVLRKKLHVELIWFSHMDITSISLCAVDAGYCDAWRYLPLP
jgi:hypothetical protein